MEEMREDGFQFDEKTELPARAIRANLHALKRQLHFYGWDNDGVWRLGAIEETIQRMKSKEEIIREKNSEVVHR